MSFQKKKKKENELLIFDHGLFGRYFEIQYYRLYTLVFAEIFLVSPTPMDPGTGQWQNVSVGAALA